jgi:membrane fusion protein, multidrug efflux system
MRPAINARGWRPWSGHLTAAACQGLLVANLLFVAACTEQTASGKVGAPVPRGVPVTAAIVEQKAIPVQVRAVGTVQPISSVTIKSQVDGQVFRVHFQEGQNVRKGDILFTLDPGPFEATLRQAKATLARERAQLLQAEAALAQSRAAAKQAEANLTRDMAQVENAKAQEHRYKTLIDDGAEIGRAHV